MSHRHTTDFHKLQEGLKAQTKLATKQGLKIEKLNKNLKVEKKRWAEEMAALEQKVQDTTS